MIELIRVLPQIKHVEVGSLTVGDCFIVAQITVRDCYNVWVVIGQTEHGMIRTVNLAKAELETVARNYKVVKVEAELHWKLPANY